MTNKIVYSKADGCVCIVNIVDTTLSIEDHVKFSVPVVVTADGQLMYGVSEPVSVVVGDYLDYRIAVDNNIEFDTIPYYVVPADSIGEDRVFRDAWRVEGKSLEVALDPAKLIAHEIRRQQREIELKPLDESINHSIGNQTAVAAIEAQRQVIRDKYADIQEEIDAVADVPSLREIVDQIKEQGTE